MKGDATVIEYLNKALTNELTAINQYWLCLLYTSPSPRD